MNNAQIMENARVWWLKLGNTIVPVPFDRLLPEFGLSVLVEPLGETSGQ